MLAKNIRVFSWSGQYNSLRNRAVRFDSSTATFQKGFTLDPSSRSTRKLEAPFVGIKPDMEQKGMRFDVPAEPWVKRESAWNHYYLRSSQTFDDFFGEHILNQNGFYQYTMGFQGAARDPLAALSSLPFQRSRNCAQCSALHPQGSA